MSLSKIERKILRKGGLKERLQRRGCEQEVSDMLVIRRELFCASERG